MTRPPLSDEILTQNRDVWDAMQAQHFVRDIEAAASAYAALLGRKPAWRSADEAFMSVLFTLDNMSVVLLAPPERVVSSKELCLRIQLSPHHQGRCLSLVRLRLCRVLH